MKTCLNMRGGGEQRLHESASAILYRAEREKRRRPPRTREQDRKTMEHVRGLSRRSRHPGPPMGIFSQSFDLQDQLRRVRIVVDPEERNVRLENDSIVDLLRDWKIQWGKLSGETEAERMERLGDREDKIPGQCPHLIRQHLCFSMRELGSCEYLHIPNRPTLSHH